MKRAHVFQVRMHLDGTDRSTVTIAPTETDAVVEIRPHGKHYVYSGLLSVAAEIIAARDAKLKARAQR